MPRRSSRKVRGPRPPAFHILAAVEDPVIRRCLVDFLNVPGFQPEEANSIDAVPQAIQDSRFDAVLLGIDLSSQSGIELCRQLRAIQPDLGIVVVRTGGGAEAEIDALNAGADDCVAPPLRFRPVVARVSAALRQVRVETALKSPALKSTMLCAGQLNLDIDRRRFWRGNVETYLSHREFDLLLLLMRNPEVILTHARILRSVWGGTGEHNAADLRSCIRTLRGKIEENPTNPAFVLTEPWVGYRFHVPH